MVDRSSRSGRPKTRPEQRTPGPRIPRARALLDGFTILIDTRERYPYRFAGRDVKAERMALAARDYAVANAEARIAVVERKTIENFTTSLSDGTLAFQMQRLGEVARAAVVVEGGYSALFTLEHVPSDFISDGLARLQVRYPEIPVVFCRLEEVRRGMDLSVPRSGVFGCRERRSSC
jgi:ERCC4-type nuclease